MFISMWYCPSLCCYIQTIPATSLPTVWGHNHSKFNSKNTSWIDAVRCAVLKAFIQHSVIWGHRLPPVRKDRFNTCFSSYTEGLVFDFQVSHLRSVSKAISLVLQFTQRKCVHYAAKSQVLRLNFESGEECWENTRK